MGIRVPHIRHLAPSVLLVLVSTTVSVGFAEAMFRWYAEHEFTREFPESTGNLIRFAERRSSPSNPTRPETLH